MEFERTAGRNRQLNLTPLIDVVFLLIVFFMLSSNFNHVDAISLSFPSSPSIMDSEMAEEAVTPVVIVVADQGRLFYRTTPVEPDQLTERLEKALQDDPNRQVLVMSTNNVTVQEVIAVMDLVHQVGGTNISISDWHY